MTLRTETDKETGVAVVTLDRPEKRNAIDLATADELGGVWREFRFDDEVRAVVVTGAGGRGLLYGASTGTWRCRSPRPRTRSTIR